jgi:hypothetical protein
MPRTSVSEMNAEDDTRTPLKAIFDAARRFGLTDDEVWKTVDASLDGAGRDATVRECLDDLAGALARRILAKERRGRRPGYST